MAAALLPSKNQPSRMASWFAVLFGVFLGFSLIKFGNPVVLDYLVSMPKESLAIQVTGSSAPQDMFGLPEEAGWLARFYEPWSFVKGLWICAGFAIFSLFAGRWRNPRPLWLMLLPLAWLIWQWICGLFTIDARLSWATLLHFSACVGIFYMAWFCLPQAKSPLYFLAGLLLGFGLVLWEGLQQHYGGLEQVRRLIYEQPNWRDFPPELLQRLAKGRIYATLVYPNALAGAILLLLPPCTVALWKMTERLPMLYRGVAAGLLVYTALACLVWSGSKAGWLIALLVAWIVLLHLPLSRRIKVVSSTALIIIGLAGFAFKYSSYFRAGASSVGARFDYWRVALKVAQQKPIFGNGPGAFFASYQVMKEPEAEMARLVHNDYLEQASDSGIPGFLLYGATIFGFLLFLYRYTLGRDILFWSVWLGLLGWALQGFVEFGLYIPALAWTAFAFFGWLLGMERLIGHRTRNHNPPPSGAKQ